MPNLNPNQFLRLRGRKMIEEDIANTIKINQHYHNARVREGRGEHSPLRPWTHEDAGGIASRLAQPGTPEHRELTEDFMEHGAAHIEKMTHLSPQVRPGVVNC